MHKVNWAAVDWQWHDRQIAAQVEVSVQRVGQKRRELGLPPVLAPSRMHAVQAQHRARQLVQTYHHVPNEMLSRHGGVPIYRVAEARRELGLTRRGHGHKPWSLFNWELPNVDLAAIWGMRPQYLARLRGKHQLSPARWHRHGGYRPADSAYQRALNEEREKAGTVQRQRQELERG